MKARSHDIVVVVKRRMLEALRQREDLTNRVRGYRVEGRTKGLVSTFRKVMIYCPASVVVLVFIKTCYSLVVA